MGCFYPKLTEQRQQTLTTEAFLGYDHNLKLSDGEFCDMENLTSDSYPLLAPRARRGTVQALSGVQAICARDALCWVQNQVLYINGASMEGLHAVGEHQGGRKAARFHGRIFVHLSGRDLFQYREVFRQRLYGAGRM